jgi:hypothetical protein
MRTEFSVFVWVAAALGCFSAQTTLVSAEQEDTSACSDQNSIEYGVDVVRHLFLFSQIHEFPPSLALV